MTPAALAARILAATGALIGWTVLALEFPLVRTWLAEENPDPTLFDLAWRFLAYFTILTNILVAAVFTHGALLPARRSGLGGPRMELAAVVAISMTALIYSVALRHLYTRTGLDLWLDHGLHDLQPLLFLLYWMLRPHGGLRWTDAAVGVVWPVAYCVYALARGAVDGWHPYFFIDAGELTILELGRNIAVLAAVFLFASLIFVAADKCLARRHAAKPADPSPA